MVCWGIGATGISVGRTTIESEMNQDIKNILTIDIEEYFHSPAFNALFGMDRWPLLESRMVFEANKILGILDEFKVTATFFILGWIAERFPEIIKEIHARGHEIACHGYSHRFVYKLTPAEFRWEVEYTMELLNGLGGETVQGYRAPAFTITDDSLWALDILAEMGFKYDASIYPIYRPRYGIPSCERFMHRINAGDHSLVEIPASTITMFGRNWPVAGGGYLRLFPYSFTRWAIRKINAEGQPAVVYFHPEEVDPDQPRLKPDPKNRFTHYVGLGTTENKLRRLLQDFSFGPIRDFMPAFDAGV